MEDWERLLRLIEELKILKKHRSQAPELTAAYDALVN